MTYIATTMFIGLVIGAILIFLVRRDHMHGAYAVWWACVAVGIALLGFFPGIVDVIGRHLGVAYPPVLIIVLGICLILVKMLTMDIERSRQERKVRRLAQRMAILEAVIESHEKAHQAERSVPKHRN